MRGTYAITHWGHTLVVILLIVTGAFLFFPELRAFFSRGYFLTFSKIHRYSGIVYIPLTTAFVLHAFKNNAEINMVSSLIKFWKKIHIKAIALLSFVFSFSGFMMWFSDFVPLKTLDLSALVHQGLTLILLITLSVHISILGIKNKFKDGV